MHIGIVDGERQRGAFSNPAISWYYVIYVNTRDNQGLVSRRTYSSVMRAWAAGDRKMKSLIKEIQDVPT
jgi:hypothetical protein